MRSHFGTGYRVDFDVDVFLVSLLNKKWFRNVFEYFYVLELECIVQGRFMMGVWLN